jgi:hypothetical protein
MEKSCWTSGAAANRWWRSTSSWGESSREAVTLMIFYSTSIGYVRAMGSRALLSSESPAIEPLGVSGNDAERQIARAEHSHVEERLGSGAQRGTSESGHGGEPPRQRV